MILHIAQSPMHAYHLIYLFNKFLGFYNKTFFFFSVDADVFFQAWSSLCSDLFVQFLEKKNFSVISYSTISIRFLSVDAVVSFCELNNLNNFLKLHVEHLITTDLFFQFLEKHSMLPLWMRMLSFANYTIFPSDACEIAVVYLLRLP